MIIKQFVDTARRDFEQLSDRTIFHLDDFVGRLNRQLIAQDLSRHATVFAGILNTSTDIMSYCCAAQFPPPIVFGEDYCEPLATEGMAVGLFEDAVYHMHEKSLKGLDGFFFCTDGILEILDKPSLAEKELLLKEVVADGNHTISSFSTAIGLSAVEGLPDDITILTLNRSR